MAELDYFFMGIAFGFLPAMILVVLQIKSIGKFFQRLIYNRNAVSVFQVQTNRQISHKIGKIDGQEVIVNKTRLPFNEKELLMDGRIPGIVFYPQGQQLKASGDGTVYPLTAREYNNALMAAMIAAADSIIVKHLNQQRLLLFAAVGLSAAGAFFGYNLVQSLIK